MLRKKESGDKAATELNLTPMIDVTFLLLVFFLVGCKLKEPEGKLNATLPKDTGPPVVEAVGDHLSDQIVIQVKMKPDGKKAIYQLGELRFDTITKLEQKLTGLYDPEKPQKDQRVVIDTDPAASYDDVLQVLNSCVRAGFEDISFAAPVPNGSQNAGDSRD